MAEEPNSTSTGPPTSRTLLSRMGKGDESAWAEGLRRYTARAFGCLTRLGLTTHGADEVWQEAWLRIWRYLPEFDASKGCFRAWLLQVMRNQARDWGRRLQARTRDARLTEGYDAPLSADDPEGTSRWEALEGKCVESLEERCRRIEHA